MSPARVTAFDVLLAVERGGFASDLLLARRYEIEIRMQAVQLESDIAHLWGQLNFLIPDGAGATHASVPAQPSANRGKEPR